MAPRKVLHFLALVFRYDGGSYFIRWQRLGGVGPSGFGVWEGPESCIPRVMGYVFFSPQGKGHGVAVYDSFHIEAIAKRVI